MSGAADVDEPGLDSVAKEMGAANGRRVTTQRVDVGDGKQIENFAQSAIANLPSLNIVINNAGVALRGDFDDQARREQEQTAH